MAEVELPQLGESVTEGIVTAWLVAVGDTVAVDQPIVEISTDKVDTEIPSPVAGTVTELRAQVDDTIEVGQVLAVIAADAEGGTTNEESATGPSAGEATSEGGQAPEDRPAAGHEQPASDAPAGSDSAGSPAQTSRAERVSRGEEHDADVVVLGGGTGGYSAALRAAQLGLDVVMIESEKVGGTCLHWGCIPTKALLQSAEVAESAQRAAEFGVQLDYHGIEIAAVNAHKTSVVDKMWKGLVGTLKTRGVETIAGVGRLVDATTVEVETEEGARRVSAPAIVVATGSEPRELPFARFDGKRILSSDHALHLEELPATAIVLGSGAVGMEFATAWHAFGVEVTVVELEDRLLPLEDADVSKEVQRAFRKQGITTLTATKLTEVRISEDGVACALEAADGSRELAAEVLLVAVGRQTRVQGIGLEEVGVAVDDRGFVTVDDRCRTSVPGIYAVGDVIATLGLAHASFAEGYLVADQLAGLEVTPIDYRGVPRVTYSHPEVASVGYTQAQAEAEGFEVVVERYPFQSLGRAAMMKATGSVKLIAERDDARDDGLGRVLGIHLVGPRATDLIAEAQLIYNWEALPSEVAQFIHPHPSLSEAIGEAHLAIAGRGLHG